MNKIQFLPFTVSFSLVLLCVVAALVAFLVGFEAGSEQFLKGFDLALGSLIGCIATIVAGNRATERHLNRK